MAGKRQVDVTRDPPPAIGVRLPSTGLIVLVVALVVGCVALVAAGQFFHRVDPGFAGVKVDYGSGTATGRPKVTSLATGQYIFLNPFTERVAEYPISQQSLTMVRSNNEGQVQGDDSVNCQDKNGIPLHIDSTTLWRVDPAHVGDLFLLKPDVPLANKEGGDISSTVVRREVRNAIAIGCSKYRYDEIYGAQRQDFGDTIAKILEPNLTQTYVDMDKFLLGEIHLEKTQEDANNAKVVAEQAAIQSGFLKQKADNEAAAAVAQAEGQKKVTILAAEAQAEAIRTINQQLSTSAAYVNYLYATKWDGHMPSTIVGGTGTTPLLPIGAMLPISSTEAPKP